MEISIIFISFFLTTISLILFQKLYIKKNIVDRINKRSSHAVIATRSGGIALFASIFCISSFFYIQGIKIYDFSILIPLSILLVVGCYDDVYNVDFKLKFVFQIIAAKVMIDSGFIIDNLHGFLGIGELNRIVAQLFTIFIIVTIINSINFIDGIDALALSIVSLFIILFEFFATSETSFFYLSIIILAATIPMFYFNLKSDKKIFLGDAGSLFLGGIISLYVLNILSSDYVIKAEYDLNKIIFVISILSYPIIDIIRICFKRIKKGKSPFQPDKGHIHHILLNKYSSHRIVTTIIISIMLVLLVALQVIFNGNKII
jgi:UDP-N-acetylmuramyl pentapeptide phosphotransferase/UDP-N-acetylglucosamine-1-phosphate transferase